MSLQAEQNSATVCPDEDHLIEKCLICRQILDEISLSYSHSLGYSESSKIFSVCCRMLKINEKNKMPNWNFDIEILPFCFECMAFMNELSQLYIKLDKIQKEIMKIKKATQIKILVAGHQDEKGKDCKDACEKNKRNIFFRNQAVKDFVPILRLKNIMDSRSVVIQSQTKSESTSSAELSILTKSGDAVKHLIMRTGDAPVKKPNKPAKTPKTVAAKEEIPANCSVMEVEIKEELENIFDGDNYSAPSSPCGFDDSPPPRDNFNEDEGADDHSILKDSGNFENDIIRTVKSRKRKTSSGTKGRFTGTADNVHSDPDYSAEDMEQESENESDNERIELRSRRRRITEEGNKILCEGVEYSENDCGLFLCGLCHYSCTHMELLRHHVKKTHLKREPSENDDKVNSTAILTAADDNDIIVTDIRAKYSTTKPEVSHLKNISQPSSRRRQKLSKEKNDLLCEGVKYSKNSSDLLLCSLCHYVCTSLESLGKHIKSSHLATEGQVTVPMPLTEPEPNLVSNEESSLPKIVYKQYDYTTNEMDGKSECSTCNKSFDSRDEVILHIQIDHIVPDNLEADYVKRLYKQCEYLVSQNSRKCKCCTCNTMFRSQQAVILHINEEHAGSDLDKNILKENGNECEYKGFKYTKGPTTMKCSSCKESFKTRESMLGHITLVHAKEKLDIVVKIGETVKALESGNWKYQNVEFSMDESTGQLVCGHCSRMYISLAAIQYHIRNSKEGAKNNRANWIRSKRVGHNKWKVGNIKYYKDDETGRYCCSLCNKAYNGRRTVMQHIRFIHLAGKTKDGNSVMTIHGVPRQKFLNPADVVQRLSENKWLYRDEEFSKDPSTGQYSCGKCGNLYKSRMVVKSHILYIHGMSSKFTIHGTPRKKFINPEDAVDKIQDGKWRFRNVEITKDGTKYLCGICGAAYRLLETTKKHIKFIHLTSKDQYGRAAFTVHGTERKCNGTPRENLGDGKFRWRGVEYSLADCEEGSPLRKFQCFRCGYENSVKTHQICHNHIRSYHLERENECPLCGKKYINRRELERHKLSHEPEGSFQCDQCGVVTRSLGALTAHKKNVHLKIRTCVCHFCGKSFFRQKDCTIHMRIHTKEKPYKCDFPGCNSSFSIKITLQKHMMTHDRHKPVKRSRATNLRKKTRK